MDLHSETSPIPENQQGAPEQPGTFSRRAILPLIAAGIVLTGLEIRQIILSQQRREKGRGHWRAIQELPIDGSEASMEIVVHLRAMREIARTSGSSIDALSDPETLERVLVAHMQNQWLQAENAADFTTFQKHVDLLLEINKYPTTKIDKIVSREKWDRVWAEKRRAQAQ